MARSKRMIWWSKFHQKHLYRLKLRFVGWWHKKHPGKYCWADCVMWAMRIDSFNPWKIDGTSSCKKESEETRCKTCYCGIWEDGLCWDLLDKAEQERRTVILKAMKQEVGDDLPF